MDLATRFPAQGQIHLESRFLFAEPGERNRQQCVGGHQQCRRARGPAQRHAPIRKIAQIEAEKRHQQELRQSYALERKAV